MSVDTETCTVTETDPGETYAFRISDDDGKTFRQVATGLPWGAVQAHMERVEAAEGGPHLAGVVTREGFKFISRGGPKDGTVWSWEVER